MVANQGVADGSHETPYYGLTVAKSLLDSGQVKRVSDLRGRPVNLLSVGSLAELNVDDALRTDGLTLNDVQVQQLAFPDSLAALRNGSLAASFMIEPFITLGKQQGILDVLVSSEKVAPGREITEVFYAAQFAQNTAAANNFMAAYLAGVSQEAGRTAKLLGLGTWTGLAAEGQHGHVHLTPPTGSALLLVVRGRAVPMGRLAIIAQRAAVAARRWLEAQA